MARIATFTALSYPNYRLWFMGQLASLVGTWMQGTAQGYLIFELTRSPVYLGYIGFAGGLPTWLFILWAGVIADNMPRRTLLVITQSVMMMLAFILAGLTGMGIVQPWHIVVLSFLLGIANAFDAPARQAFVLEMVEREDLDNAIALNAAMFNSAGAIGPAVAGITYAALGPFWCFTINGLSFIAVIAALLAMRLKPFQPPPQRPSPFSALKEGLSYVRSNFPIRTVIIMIGVITLLVNGYGTLIPAWAVDILKGDSATNGYLQSARGLGALIGALVLASLGRFRAKGRLLTLGAFLFPLMIVLFSQVNRLWLSLLILVGVGWGSMWLFNNANALVQTHSPNGLRGRIISVYTLVFFGMMPLSSLLAGTLADAIGLTTTVLLTALVALVFALGIYIAAPSIHTLK